MLRRFYAGLAVLSVPIAVTTQEVRLTDDMKSTSFEIVGETYVVARSQNNRGFIEQEFAKTGRPCPPFCITDMVAADGVKTIGELEVNNFVENVVANGKDVLVDSRDPSWFSEGTIPSAMNMYFPALDKMNPFHDDILTALGGAQTDDGWNFDNAIEMTMFRNGPWSDETTRAINNLISLGYPAEKLQYYRGGMQVWKVLGLSVEVPA